MVQLLDSNVCTYRLTSFDDNNFNRYKNCANLYMTCFSDKVIMCTSLYCLEHHTSTIFQAVKMERRICLTKLHRLLKYQANDEDEERSVRSDQEKLQASTALLNGYILTYQVQDAHNEVKHVEEEC